MFNWKWFQFLRNHPKMANSAMDQKEHELYICE
jgi:hypothetical protein